MAQQVKNEWIINNKNIFGLPKDISLSLSHIQYEIMTQLEGENINFMSDYLGAKIDISRKIKLTNSLTIQSILNDFLGHNTPLANSKHPYPCAVILPWLQFTLYQEYGSNGHKEILIFTEYKNQYTTLLGKYLSTNIDTNEKDFINVELSLCESLISELDKPIYNNILISNEVGNKPCEFKKDLINSIDKREKYLLKKQFDLPNKITDSSPPPPKNTKAVILKEYLSEYGFFEIEKIKHLSEAGKASIIKKLSESPLAYVIAMLDYLQFITHLEKNYLKIKKQLNRQVSQWFDSDKEGRAVKGNISVLSKNTKEDKKRYKAHLHKENVIKEYEQLK